MKAQHTTAYSPGSSITSQLTNFLTARLLWASRRPRLRRPLLPKEARNTSTHRSRRWLSAESARLRPHAWRAHQQPLPPGGPALPTSVQVPCGSKLRPCPHPPSGTPPRPPSAPTAHSPTHLLPSWKRANSRDARSSTVSAVTPTGPLAELGKQPCTRTSCQSECTLQISTESKYLGGQRTAPLSGPQQEPGLLPQPRRSLPLGPGAS